MRSGPAVANVARLLKLLNGEHLGSSFESALCAAVIQCAGNTRYGTIVPRVAVQRGLVGRERRKCELGTQHDEKKKNQV